MLLIDFIHYIAWCFDLINAKSGSKEGGLLFVNEKIVSGSGLLVWSFEMTKVGF
jgi:hypothetical protein